MDGSIFWKSNLFLLFFSIELKQKKNFLLWDIGSFFSDVGGGNINFASSFLVQGPVVQHLGAPVAQWVKRWPTDLVDRVRSSPEVKSSQP